MAAIEDSLLNDALAALRKGAVEQAEKPLRRILRRHPDHAVALNILGVVLSQQKRYREAEASLLAAIKLQPPSATTLYNYGLVLKAQHRPLEALAQFDQALACDGNAPDVWNARGAVLNDLKRFGEALTSFDRALRLNPNSAEAAFNKANSLHALCRDGEAVALYDQLLRVLPQWPELWSARGAALWQLGAGPAAKSAFERALALNPDVHGAMSGLGQVVLDGGDAARAFSLAQQMLARQDTPEARALAAACLQSPLLAADTPNLVPILMRAIAEVWTRPSTLAPICARCLMADPVGPLDSPLLSVTLENMLVASPELEAFVTEQRRRMLATALASCNSTLPSNELRLARAIAMQGFITAYVFAETDAEKEDLAKARSIFLQSLQEQGPASELLLLVLASYAPLHTLAVADAILARPWSDMVAPVLDQQLHAWRKEQDIRATLPAMTPITGDISEQVRNQYEESPYPHWVHLETAAPTDLASLLHGMFPEAIGADMRLPDAPNILIAGCGTGRSSIQLALQLPRAQLLAIDLSLTSLSYAKRQALLRRVANVEYAQADITRIATLDRRFDMIESMGVLHHLADPFAGWQNLLALLNTGGVMRLGFYSEISRRDVVAGRDFIASRGYGANADDIRRCRQDILGLGEADRLQNLTRTADFYNLNDFRDLVFHVQEHRLDLPDITAFLDSHHLTFLGFDLDPAIKRRYAQRFPADTAMTDLTSWHRFEMENPYTFVEMYQFWVQKRR